MHIDPKNNFFWYHMKFLSVKKIINVFNIAARLKDEMY